MRRLKACHNLSFPVADPISASKLGYQTSGPVDEKTCHWKHKGESDRVSSETDWVLS